MAAVAVAGRAEVGADANPAQRGWTPGNWRAGSRQGHPHPL